MILGAINQVITRARAEFEAKSPRRGKQEEAEVKPQAAETAPVAPAPETAPAPTPAV
jgi:hypothetical protein